MERKKVTILFSGGLESTALIKYFKEKENFEISLIYISFGYFWEKAEFNHAKKIAEYFNLSLDFINLTNSFETKQLGLVDTLEKNIIPLRNLSLFTFSSFYMAQRDINTLAIGLQEDLNYPDTNKEYINTTEELIRKGLQNQNFNNLTPFYKISKDEIISKFDLPLNLIFSCTNPIGLHRCHKCFKCKKLDLLIKQKS